MDEIANKNNVNYRLAYSNFTFELWMILHKINAEDSLSHRDDYKKLLKRAYKESFTGLSDYKSARGFSVILQTLGLDDVKKQFHTQNLYRIN